MAIKIFTSFNEANQYAKQLSAKLNKTISYGGGYNNFYVETGEEINEAEEYEAEELPYITNDYDYEDTQRLLTEDAWDTIESSARSEDEGWYYDDTDEGGWENSISSQSYD